MQKDKKNVGSYGELNPALPIQSQVSLPPNHQLMKIAWKYGKFEKILKSNTQVHNFFQVFDFWSNFHQLVVGR